MGEWSSSRSRRRGGEPPSVRAELAKFALAGILALLVLGVAGAVVLTRVTRDEAVEDAKQLTEVVARGVVDPNLSDGLLRGDRRAVAQLDRAVRSRVLDRDVVRVRVWRRDGRILYSDRHELVGARYQLGPDELEILRDGGVDAEVSDLSAPENRFERRFGKLLEVYLQVKTPSGEPVLFETYQRYDAVSRGSRDLLRSFAPPLIGALIVFELIQLPLALALARRVRRGHQERAALLERALDASDMERRRIAADLHDGTVQELVAASYSLAAARERLGTNGGAAAEAIDSAANTTRGAVGELRSLLVDIYPPRLREAGLVSVLSDLAEHVEERGIKTSVDAPVEVELSDDVSALLYRTAQEAVRNVVAHSGAEHLDISLHARDGMATLVVRDDGQGFSPEQALARQEKGHFGLRLLSDRVHDEGGELSIDSKPGEGTRVCAEVPLT